MLLWVRWVRQRRGDIGTQEATVNDLQIQGGRRQHVSQRPVERKAMWMPVLKPREGNKVTSQHSFVLHRLHRMWGQQGKLDR